MASRTDNKNKDANGRARVQTENKSPSLTVLSDQPASEIREILKQYKQLGIADNLNSMEAQYADISELTDYADAMRIVRSAEAEFMTLPSKVREILDHDVATFLDTAHDQEKRDALVAAGFMDAPEAAGGSADPGVTGTSVDGATAGDGSGATEPSATGGTEPA